MPPGDTVLLITDYGMGKGPQDLRLTLISKYLELLAQSERLSAAICLYTEGVKLAVEGSPVLAQLGALEAGGTRILLCSTCLNYFELTDKVRVGIIGGMTDILEAQLEAGKVITL
jgi:hypothetical protein